MKCEDLSKTIENEFFNEIFNDIMINVMAEFYNNSIAIPSRIVEYYVKGLLYDKLKDKVK